MENKKVLLSVKDLHVKFRVRGRILTAIRGVSLDFYENESIAIVGESGSGKSVFTKTFAGMLETNGYISEGSLIFNDEELADTDVVVSMDGVRYTLPAGSEVRLTPGESITLTPGLYHRFWGEEGKGTVLVSEVSMCNDDANDNRFHDKVGRFPEIEEDEAPLHLLCNEYDK